MKINRKMIYIGIFIEIIFLLIIMVRPVKNIMFRPADIELTSDQVLTYQDENQCVISAIPTEEEVDKDYREKVMAISAELPSGAYDIAITYSALIDEEHIEDKDYSTVGFLQLNSNPSNKLRLREGSRTLTNRFWIKTGDGNPKTEIQLIYQGRGSIAVQRVEVREKISYRVIRFMEWLLLFLIMDGLIALIFVEKEIVNRKTKFVLLSMIGIGGFSSLPFMTDFLFFGHDLEFHLYRIVSLAQSLQDGIIPHRIQYDMLEGYGYASPLFYGELFLTLPAILYNLGMPLQTTYQVYAIAMNIFTCVISYECFKRIAKDEVKGIFASAIYTCSTYRLVNLILRAAVGEYTALAFFPLLIYAFWVIYHKKDKEKIEMKDYACLILAMTGILQSHTLSCEMVAIFIIAISIVFWRKLIQANIFVALSKSVVVTLLLNAWFVIPFLQSMTMDVRVKGTDNIDTMQEHGAYFMQLLGIFHSAIGGSKENTMKDEMPIAIGAVLVVSLLIFAFVLAQKNSWKLWENEGFKVALVAATGGVVAIIFSTIYFPWRNITHMIPGLSKVISMVQFPWRYLGIATILLVFMIVLTLNIIQENTSKKIVNTIMISLIGIMLLTEGQFMTAYANEQDIFTYYTSKDIESNGIMNGEYYLADVTVDVIENLAVTQEEGVEVASFRQEANRYTLDCNNNTDSPKIVDIPVFAYDNFHIYLEDGSEIDRLKAQGGRIRMNVPARYQGMITVAYGEPRLWVISDIVSLMTIIMLIGIMIKNRISKKGLKMR